MGMIYVEGPGFSPPFLDMLALRCALGSKSLDRTQGAGTSRRVFSISFFIKTPPVFGFASQIPAGTGGAGRDVISFDHFNITFDFNDAASNAITTGFTASISTYYHVLMQCDFTQAVASDRVKILVNGVDKTNTAVSSYPAQNYDSSYGLNGSPQSFLTNFDNSSWTMDEVAFFDGTVVTYADVVSGGKPKDLSSLPFGLQGSWLRFETGLAATVGHDSSPNGNDWTNTNFVDADFVAEVP